MNTITLFFPCSLIGSIWVFIWIIWMPKELLDVLKFKYGRIRAICVYLYLIVVIFGCYRIFSQ